MAMQLYNTLTRKKDVLQPIRPDTVGIYSCGPTVYWFAHIGNMRAYIFADVLRRVLQHRGYTVHHIVNITDVGHLTDDADDGEDKMIAAMRREGKSAADIARFYEQAFHRDSALLNILPAERYPRATEHIAEQIAFIERMVATGVTYQTSDGVYVDVSQVPQYGRLSGQALEEKLAGARVAQGEKRHAFDFALWKFSPTDATREMEWPSPWGRGFPGWHIECSAMAKKYLGIPFDIHTGGVDHIAVHHENEIAQAQVAEQALEANVWLHSEFLTVDGQKMSKSLGNIYTISDLQEKQFNPLSYRYFVLGAHYRTLLNFTFEGLTAAENALRKLRAIARESSAGVTPAAAYVDRFFASLEDDVRTPDALAVLWEMVNDESISSAERGATLIVFDHILGLGLESLVGVPEVIPDDIRRLIEDRETARRQKDWAASDRLRDQLLGLGWAVEDTATGPRATRRSSGR